MGVAASLEAVSPYQLAGAIGGAAVPMLVTAGWLDSGTAAGALDGFTSLPGPRTVVIGAFSHGGAADSDPLRAPRPAADPPIEAQYVEALAFLVQACEAVLPAERVIRYATLGDDTWRTTATWPPPTVAARTFQLAAGGALLEAVGASGQDGYAVDLGASTGRKNRWLTPIDGSPVDYGDRAAADARLLTYTSAPLPTDTRVTGTPVVRLRMSVDAVDAAVLVYLEDVDADGVSRYVTEGELRLVHRAGGAPGPGAERITGRTYRRDAATGYAPGSVIDLVIPLQPTSAKFRAGHRIRVAIAGADADTFAPVTPAGTNFIVQRGAGVSSIELPVDSAP